MEVFMTDDQGRASVAIGVIAAERVRQALAAVTSVEGASSDGDIPGSGDGCGPGVGVPGGLRSCVEGVDVALAGVDRVWALDESLVRDCLITAEFLLARVQALRNGLVRSICSHGDSPAVGKRMVRGVLEEVCHVSASRSGRVVDSAALTDPDTGILRALGGALAAGEVTGEHVEVARVGVSRISPSILRDYRAQVDALITEHARNHPPEATAQLLAFLEQRLGVGRLERAPGESRRLALVHGVGASFLSGQIDAATGRKLDALLDALIAQSTVAGHLHTPIDKCRDDPRGDPGGDAALGAEGFHDGSAFTSAPTDTRPDPEGWQEQIAILDTRTLAQKRADAFSELVDLAGDHLALVRDPVTGAPVMTGVGGHLNRKPLHSVARLVLHCHPDTPPAAGALDSATDQGRVVPDRGAAAGGRLDEAPPPQPDAARESDMEPVRWSETGCAGEGCDGSARWAGFAASTDDQSPLHPVLTDLHACDAVFDLARFDGRGRLISFTSVGRLAGDRLTAAVIARDQCCSFPGCTRPPAMCHVHHVIWHRHGGPTSLDNLALLCGRHHRLIHAHPNDPRDAWLMGMRDGIPHVQPPARLTPRRFPKPPWIRNTHPADLARTRRLARQLELDTS